MALSLKYETLHEELEDHDNDNGLGSKALLAGTFHFSFSYQAATISKWYYMYWRNKVDN